MPRRKHRRSVLKRLTRTLRKLSMRTLYCRRGQHDPERKRATWTQDAWHTHCRNCGLEMRRESRRNWVPVD